MRSGYTEQHHTNQWDPDLKASTLNGCSANSTLPTPKQQKQKPATSRLAPQKPNQPKDHALNPHQTRLPATQGIKTFSSSLTSVEEGPLTHGLARWHQVSNQVHLTIVIAFNAYIIFHLEYILSLLLLGSLYSNQCLYRTIRTWYPMPYIHPT